MSKEEDGDGSDLARLARVLREIEAAAAELHQDAPPSTVAEERPRTVQIPPSGEASRP